jgi:hypothetical protein
MTIVAHSALLQHVTTGSFILPAYARGQVPHLSMETNRPRSVGGPRPMMMRTMSTP